MEPSDNLWSFALAGISLIVSPGPATLSMAAVGSRFGFRSGIRYLNGCALGLIIVMVLVVFGLTQTINQIPGVGFSAAIAGSLYILYLAWKIARSSGSNDAGSLETPPGLVGGVIVSLSNPKAWAVMGALFASQGSIAPIGRSQLISQMIVLAIITFGGNVGWTFLGDRISDILNDPVRGRVLNVGFAVLLVISVFWAILL